AATGGNIYAANATYYGACSESYAFHHTDPSFPLLTYSAVDLTAGTNDCILETSLTSAAIGDIVLLVFSRDGTNILDTTDRVDFVGWVVSYTADM
ncbi:MAG: hypothetical protein KKA73_14000, partial [Chloroflexi bacterium]|nr:hypothetical protein [Chloroflexota bacterium]